MELLIHAKPSSSSNIVEKIVETEYIVRTTEPPVQGRANRSIIKLLAEHFSIHCSRITITGGHTSRTKKISIL